MKMFLHNFKYALKTMLKNKSAILWTLLFPIALGTFMYMSFGDVFEKDAIYKEIPVAVVKKADNINLESTLETLGTEGKEQMIDISYMDESDALSALNNDEVTGIIYIDDIPQLSLKENSYNGTVLKAIMDTYVKRMVIIEDIVSYAPQMLENTMDNLSSEQNYINKQNMSDGNQDAYTNYFYAIFAMSCLFASFGAVEKISNIQANVSALGIRRCVSPNNKMLTILSEFLSMLFVQFVIELIVLIYFNIIGIDFGDKMIFIPFILLFGSCIGIAIGIIIGTITKISLNTKSGLCVLIGMVLSVMADLVAAGVKHSIEQICPLINRINPAALIVDSFYALNIYDTYDRFIKNMLTLAGISFILIFISFMILRRNKYESV